MSTLTVQTVAVAKKAALDKEQCEFVAGIVFSLPPMVLLTPPRPIADARGTLNHDQLRTIANKHQPPQEWYEGEEEQLF